MGITDERFLEIANDMAKCSDCGHCGNEKFCDKCELVGVIETYELRYFYERIGELAGAMQQGLLVKLPCKVGDTVYLKIGGRPGYEPFRVVRMDWMCGIEYENHRYQLYLEDDFYDSAYRNFSAIGKTVFLTHEEAEAMLTPHIE